MDNYTYIGIDIAKTEICCSLPGRKPFMLPNNKAGLQSLVRRASAIDEPGNLCFVMESTSVYSSSTAEIILELAPTHTAIIPPACINGFKQSGLVRTKNDYVDAVAIREFAEAKRPACWLPPAPAQRSLRNLQVVMDNLTKAAARQKAVREKLASEYRPCATALDSVDRVIKMLEQESAALQQEIDKVIAADEAMAADSAQILSIPGIGPVVRNVIMSVCYRQLRELSQRRLLAFCGMSPREQQSGKCRGRTMMSKAGDARVRRVLYMAAMVAVRQGGLMHDYFQRQKAAGKAGKVALVNVMRRLLYIIQGVVKSNSPFDYNILQANR